MSTNAFTAKVRWTRPVATVAAAALLWISHTVLGLLAVSPLLTALRASSAVSGPRGDAVLFEPGGLMLSELLRLSGNLLGAASRGAALWLVVGLVLGLLPLAVVLDLIWIRESSLAQRASRALRLFPRFLALGAVALLAQAAVLLAGSLLSALVSSAVSTADVRVRDLAPLAVLALAVLGAGALGAVLDVARAALVQVDYVTREALEHALLRLRQRPLELLLGGYVSGAAAACAYLAAAWYTALHVTLSGPSKVPILIAFGVHQVAVLVAIAFRVRWLGRSLELSAADG